MGADEVPPCVLGDPRDGSDDRFISDMDPPMYQPAGSPQFPEALLHQPLQHGAHNFTSYDPVNTVYLSQPSFVQQQPASVWQPAGLFGSRNESYVPDHSSFSVENTPVDPETARQKEDKKKRNRDAATRCRAKRQKQHDDLSQEATKLEKERRSLLEEVAMLEGNITDRKNMLFSHQCGMRRNGGNLEDPSFEELDLL